MPKKVRRTQAHATPQEVWDLLRELTKSQKETDRQMKETDRQLKELAISINKADGNFNNKWGQFMENLVAGDLVRLLNERGIEVTRIHTRMPLKLPDGTDEGDIDITAMNGIEIVAGEVKTTLTLEKLKKNSPQFQTL